MAGKDEGWSVVSTCRYDRDVGLDEESAAMLDLYASGPTDRPCH